VCVFVAVSKLCDGVVGAAMAERLELACCAWWRRRNEKWDGEQVRQARGGVHIVAGRARTPVACGSALRRPATGGATRPLFSETGRHCSTSETAIQLSNGD